jgi:hypothetical protein
MAYYYFEPIEMEKIPGIFNGFYAGDVLYKEVAIFSNKDYPMKYFSDSQGIGDNHGSKISIFDQEFYLGKIDEQENVYADIHLSSSWWLFEAKNRTYFCSLASQRGADPYGFVLLLFDITDKRNIEFYTFTTFNLNGIPAFGFFPEQEQQLCTLRIIRDNYYIVKPYYIKDGNLIEFCKPSGDSYCLEFEWSKWKAGEILIISTFE